MTPSRSNAGGWPPQGRLGTEFGLGGPDPAQVLPQAPAGLVLPPPDTDLAKETPHSIRGSAGTFGGGSERAEGPEEISVLPDVDSAAASVDRFGAGRNDGDAKSNPTPFPTLIPWIPDVGGPRETVEPSPAPKSMPRPENVRGPGRTNGAVDGENRINGRGSQISQARRNKLAGVLEPPADSLASFGPAENAGPNDYEESLNREQGFKFGQSQGQLDRERGPNQGPYPVGQGKSQNQSRSAGFGGPNAELTESPGLEHVPPTPAHPETTWIPLRFNIRPSALNTSAASRTTQDDRAMTTRSALRGLEEELGANVEPERHVFVDPASTLRGLEQELRENAGADELPDETAPKLGRNNNNNNNRNDNNNNNRNDNNNSNNRNDNNNNNDNNGNSSEDRAKKGGGPLSFSSSFSRRGDLPIPREEEKPANNFGEGTGLFGNKINVIIDHIITQKTIDTITSLAGKRPKTRRPKTQQNLNSNATIETTVAPSTTISTRAAGRSSPCGTAPDFRPCVEKREANDRLLACCRQKLMPPGCLDLCRYDITQAEIKKAFDAAKCGIFNVAPFLECASQGQDNLGCCQHHQIAQKGGAQCEVFCNPKKGFGPLGLQHLSCQNVIGELLKCHHSGLRPF